MHDVVSAMGLVPRRWQAPLTRRKDAAACRAENSLRRLSQLVSILGFTDITPVAARAFFP